MYKSQTQLLSLCWEDLSRDRRRYKAAHKKKKKKSKPRFLRIWCQYFIKISGWTLRRAIQFSARQSFMGHKQFTGSSPRNVFMTRSINTPRPLPLRTCHGYYFSFTAISTWVVLISRLQEHLWCKDMKDEGREVGRLPNRKGLIRRQFGRD